MNVNAFLRRLTRSASARRLFRWWTLDERADLLLDLWRGLNTGLDYRERFLLLNRAYLDRRMFKLGMLDSAHQARIYGLFRMVEEVRRVPGAIVEAGVGLGFSISAFASAVAFFEIDKEIYGFDSFSGFPEAAEEDRSYRVTDLKDVGGWTETSAAMIEEVYEQDRQMPWSLLAERPSPLHLVPGFFEDTMPERLPEEIALLHADCDLYDSYKTVLEHALPRMAPGGLIIFDEYGFTERWPGAKKAVDEVSAEHGLTVEYFAFAQRHGVRLAIHPPTTS